MFGGWRCAGSLAGPASPQQGADRFDHSGRRARGRDAPVAAHYSRSPVAPIFHYAGAALFRWTKPGARTAARWRAPELEHVPPHDFRIASSARTDSTARTGIV